MGRAGQTQAARWHYRSQGVADGEWMQQVGVGWMAVVSPHFPPLLVEPGAVGWVRVGREVLLLPVVLLLGVQVMPPFRSFPLPVPLRRQLQALRAHVAR